MKKQTAKKNINICMKSASAFVAVLTYGEELFNWLQNYLSSFIEVPHGVAFYVIMDHHLNQEEHADLAYLSFVAYAKMRGCGDNMRSIIEYMADARPVCPTPQGDDLINALHRLCAPYLNPYGKVPDETRQLIAYLVCALLFPASNLPLTPERLPMQGERLTDYINYVKGLL